MSNLLIVESENDKHFIDSLIKYINVDLEVAQPVCSIDEYDCLGGMSKLPNKLEAIKGRVQKEGIEKIGIIFDADNVGVEERTRQIQEEIDAISWDDAPVEFVIHILNVDGVGELETLLKDIKNKKSSVADCLTDWQDCISEAKKLTTKEFDKIWVQIYQRYDCCTKKERKQANRKCSNEASMSKGIYDFNHEKLDDLKSFLNSL